MPKYKIKKKTSSTASGEAAKKRQQMRIFDAFGTFSFDPAYDYKAARRRKAPRNNSHKIAAKR